MSHIHAVLFVRSRLLFLNRPATLEARSGCSRGEGSGDGAASRQDLSFRDSFSSPLQAALNRACAQQAIFLQWHVGWKMRVVFKRMASERSDPKPFRFILHMHSWQLPMWIRRSSQACQKLKHQALGCRKVGQAQQGRNPAAFEWGPFCSINDVVECRR